MWARLQSYRFSDIFTTGLLPPPPGVCTKCAITCLPEGRPSVYVWRQAQLIHTMLHLRASSQCQMGLLTSLIVTSLKLSVTGCTPWFSSKQQTRVFEKIQHFAQNNSSQQASVGAGTLCFAVGGSLNTPFDCLRVYPIRACRRCRCVRRAMQAGLGTAFPREPRSPMLPGMNTHRVLSTAISHLAINEHCHNVPPLRASFTAPASNGKTCLSQKTNQFAGTRGL